VTDFSGIWGATATLKSLLEGHITLDPHFQFGGGTIAIQPLSPDEVGTGTTSVSLWLYRVGRDPNVLNDPAPRLGPDELLQRPIPVELYYLVTPRTTDTLTAHTLLGRVLQVFNDHAILRGVDLQSPLGGDDELRVTLDPLTLEDATRIWTTLSEPYQPSLSYCVQLVRIESHHEPRRARRVLRREIDYEQIVGVS
jgi:Pvc16 N-terminal domain